MQASINVVQHTGKANMHKNCKGLTGMCAIMVFYVHVNKLMSFKKSLFKLDEESKAKRIQTSLKINTIEKSNRPHKSYLCTKHGEHIHTSVLQYSNLCDTIKTDVFVQRTAGTVQTKLEQALSSFFITILTNNI